MHREREICFMDKINLKIIPVIAYANKLLLQQSRNNGWEWEN